MCTPLPEMTCSFLIQLVFCKKKKTMWFIGVEVEQETSAPPPKKNPGSTPVISPRLIMYILVRGLGGLINGEAYFRGTYNLNRKSTLKQAIALLIEIHFTFTGL